DRVGRKRWRNVNDSRVCSGLLDRLRDGIEDRNLILESLSALARRNACDDLGAVLHHLLGVKRPIAAGDALDEEAGVLVDEDAHAAFPPVASATAFLTASSMSVIADMPFFSRILTAISSFVPVSRITSGI